MVGKTISHYRVVERLGAGGMGVVYKAVDVKLERTVALKFLPNETALTESDKQQLIREARAASALDHPNIGVIYGLEEAEDGRLFIVMGYYEGETLAQKVARGAIGPRESLDIAVQIAGGLGAAHARSIVHRDMKPSNVIVTKDGVAKIVDFGLARIVATASATQSVNTSGTLPYMAPEQVLGEPVDQRADVWALGVILLQMLTGSHPFFRENSAAITFAILNQPPAGAETLAPLLQLIVYRALSKEPAHRYANAKEMLVDLEAARAQSVASAGTSTPDPATLPHLRTPGGMKQFAERASAPRWQTQTRARSSTVARLTYAVLAALVLAAVSLLFPAVRQRAAAMLSLHGEKHIAVLPFDNIGGDAANEPLAQGLMDSLTSKLSNLDAAQQALWVVPASVVRSSKVSDPGAALRELGATVVVKGSIQRAAQDVHVTVNLIDTKNLRQIGSVALEDRAGDLSALQDEAVARLARLMNINVTTEMLRDTGGSVTPAAYESYLKALGYMQRYDKPGNLDLAVAALESSVQTDPHFALGFAQLGEAYRLKNQVDPNPKWIEQASANLQRASQLNDRLPAAYVSLGRLHAAAARNDLALQEFQHALQLYPRDADATVGLAGVYERMGRVADAEANFKRAASLRPDYWDGYNSLGNFYRRQGRMTEAIAQYRRVIELTPDNATAYSNLGSTYTALGDPKALQEAETALKKSVQLMPTYPAYANLGQMYLNQKRFAEGRDMTLKALELNDKNYLVWANLLNAYAGLNDQPNMRATRSKTRSLLEQHVALYPQDAPAQSLLAIFFAEDKARDKAMQHLDASLALSPKDPSILADAAECYEDLGERARALQYARESLANGFTLGDLESRLTLQQLLADPNFRSGGKNQPREVVR
jgi:serine/threonine-protein kinase